MHARINGDVNSTAVGRRSPPAHWWCELLPWSLVVVVRFGSASA